MARKRFGAEQIIPKLREAEVEIAQGATVAAAAKTIGVTEQTYYRLEEGVRRPEDGPGETAQGLEKENARLKRLLADAELDKAILREAASGNFCRPRQLRRTRYAATLELGRRFTPVRRKTSQHVILFGRSSGKSREYS